VTFLSFSCHSALNQAIRSLPLTSFPIHYSLIVLSFDAIYSRKSKAWLNNARMQIIIIIIIIIIIA
jgi:hypothetical protein